MNKYGVRIVKNNWNWKMIGFADFSSWRLFYNVFFNARKLKTFFISFQILLQLPKLSKGRKITRNKIPEKVNLTSKLFFDMASDMHQSEHLANIPIGTIILVTKMWSVKGPFIVIDAFKRTNLTLSRQVFLV